MHPIAMFEKKRFSFPKIWSQDLCYRCKAGKGAKIGSKDGLFGVARVGGAKQKISALVVWVVI